MNTSSLTPVHVLRVARCVGWNMGIAGQDLNDLAQSVYIRLLRYPPRGGITHAGYVAMLTRSEVIDRHRARGQRELDRAEELPEGFADRAPSPYAATLACEELAATLADMPPKIRAATLDALIGFTVRESAEREGISPSGIEKRRVVALATIRRNAGAICREPRATFGRSDAGRTVGRDLLSLDDETVT